MLIPKIEESFNFNHISLIEKKLSGREIEVAVFTHKEELFISDPGEIITDGKFYDFDKNTLKRVILKN